MKRTLHTSLGFRTRKEYDEAVEDVLHPYLKHNKRKRQKYKFQKY